MGEGAAVLVLEEMEHAKARGARIYAEVLGYGTTNDAHHMTAPRPDGAQAARAMRDAMRTGGVRLEDVDVVNAHGSSTPLNDSTESKVIREVFGEHADAAPGERHQGLPRALPGRHGRHRGGHLGPDHPARLGAAHAEPGVRRRGLRPGLRDGRGLEMPVRRIVSNSFGFGGINAALAFGAVD